MFIYVMDIDAKKYLEEHGYKLLKANEDTHVYCFENKPEMEFEFNPEIQCVISSIMIF